MGYHLEELWRQTDPPSYLATEDTRPCPAYPEGYVEAHKREMTSEFELKYCNWHGDKRTPNQKYVCPALISQRRLFTHRLGFDIRQINQILLKILQRGELRRRAFHIINK